MTVENMGSAMPYGSCSWLHFLSLALFFALDRAPLMLRTVSSHRCVLSDTS
jgi:hypothetical protein